MQARDLFNLVGTTIGDKFQVEKILGEGGYGVVYGGTHLLLGQPVAIKCLKPIGFTPEERERAAQNFLREARILFGLSHPAVVRLYDVGILPEKQVPYAVLELLEGTTLADELIARAKLQRNVEREEIGSIFGPILEGVAFAHEKGVIHRDLKPGNIMLVHEGSRWQPKVLDFGTAREGQQAANIASSASMGGARTGFTPLYAAPEQWDKSIGKTSAATDVFALGVTLAEVCLLRYPFETSSGLISIFKNALDERSRPLIVEARPDLPVELEHVILRALRVKPSERYPDAREMLASFRAALKITTTTAPLAKPIAIAQPARPPLQSDPGTTMPTGSTIPSGPQRTSYPQPSGQPGSGRASALTPAPITYVGGGERSLGSTTQPHALIMPPIAPAPAQPARVLPWVIGGIGLFVTVIAVIAAGGLIAYRHSAKPAESSAGPDTSSPSPSSSAASSSPVTSTLDADAAPSPSITVDASAPHSGPRIVVSGVNGNAPFWTPAEVLDVAHAHHAELLGCAREGSNEDPELSGALYVTVHPSKTGLVESVDCSVMGSPPGEDALCGCIERVIGKWRYPPAHGKLGMLDSAPFIYSMKVSQPRHMNVAPP